MKQDTNRFFKCFSVTAAVLFAGFAALLPQPVSALSVGSSNMLFLTPGHSQTVMFELDDSVFHDGDELHAFYLFTAGEGVVTVRIGPASSIGEFAGMLYGTIGFVGLSPVFDYAYSVETLSFSMNVPAAAVGILYTGIIFEMGDPDYPIVMSISVSHQQ